MRPAGGWELSGEAAGSWGPSVEAAGSWGPSGEASRLHFSQGKFACMFCS